ncbi:MAG: hypothetical protein LBT40_05910 [Deltaproteobacteria bacterium]|nr:hypothetical protein [Deltaproteobacteria bacterium]
MQCLGLPTPSVYDASVTVFLSPLMTASRLVPPGDPGPSPDDAPAVRKAKLLFLRARAECLSSEPARPNYGLSLEVAETLSRARFRAGDPDCVCARRWHLCAAALVARAAAPPCAELSETLMSLAADGCCGGELAAALSSCAMRDPGRRESLMTCSFVSGAAGCIAGSADPLLAFAGFVMVSVVLIPPSYGPGASVPGNSGRLVNALSLAPALPAPECAAFLPAYHLSRAKKIDRPRLWRDALKDAAGLGLPDDPAFRLVWETLDLELELLAEGAGGSRGRSLFLETFAGMADRGLLSGFGRSADPALAALVETAKVLSMRLASLDQKSLARAFRIVAPFRASGELSPWAFEELFRQLRIRQPKTFQMNVMRAASDGLFGEGDALVHSMANACCVSGSGSVKLARFKREAMEISRRAGTALTPGPYCMRLADCIVSADLAARTGGGLTQAFGELASLSPDAPGCTGLRENDCFSGTPVSSAVPDVKFARDDPSAVSAAEARTLHLYSYASALTLLAMESRDKKSTPGLITELLDMLPDRSLMDPVFLDSILPGASCVPFSHYSDIEAGLALLAAFSPGLGKVRQGRLQTRAMEGLFWYMSIVTACVSEAPFETQSELGLTVLSGPLPPVVRAALVAALVVAYGNRGLASEAECIFLDNSLMLVQPQFPVKGGPPSASSTVAVPGLPSNVSWRWPPVRPEHPEVFLGHDIAQRFRPEGGAAGFATPSARDTLLAVDGFASLMENDPLRAGVAPAPLPYRPEPPEAQEAAAFAGGISCEGWKELNAWLQSRREELFAEAPDAVGAVHAANTPGLFFEASHWDWAAGSDWDTIAETMADNQNCHTGGVPDVTGFCSVARLTSEADPGDRAMILRDWNATMTAAPPLSVSGGPVIAVLDRAGPLPFTAGAVVLAELGRFGTAFECLVRDSRPDYHARLKARALARILENSDSFAGTGLAQRAAGLDLIYADNGADPKDIARIRNALGSAALSVPNSPSSGLDSFKAVSARGNAPAAGPVGKGKPSVKTNCRKSAKSRAARKAKGGKGGKGGGNKR